MTDKLLNCPFCGDYACFVNDLSGETASYSIKCTGCLIGTDGFATPEEAVEVWNRRTPPAAVPDGWAIVPCEPDDEMTDKGESALIAGPLEKEFKDAPSATWAAAKACYRAMISAAPAAPTEASDDQLP